MNKYQTTSKPNTLAMNDDDATVSESILVNRLGVNQ